MNIAEVPNMDDADLREYFDQYREGKTTTKEVLWCAVTSDGEFYTCYDGDWNTYATPQVHESGITLFYSKKPLTTLLVRATLDPFDEYILRPSVFAANLYDHMPNAAIPLLTDAHFYAFTRYQSPHTWLYTSFGCMIGPVRIEATMRNHYGNDVRLFAPHAPFTL